MQDNRLITTFIKCGHCSHRFKAGVQFATVNAFETGTARGNVETCPSCGQPINCNKNNMSYTLNEGSSGGKSPGGEVNEDYGDNKL